MEYPDNRAKFRESDPRERAKTNVPAKRGAPPREHFRHDESESEQPPPVIVEAPPPPWNAVPDAKDFEI